MKKRNSLLLTFALFLTGVAYSATNQELNVDSIDSGEEVATVNDNLRRTSANKLDSRPGNVEPRKASYYDLGSSTYPWKGIYGGTITVNNLQVRSITTTGPLTFSGVWDGWVSSTNTWTYISASQFSVPGNTTGHMSVGDKVYLSQTSDKYFYIVAIAAGVGVTTVTVSGGTDYTLANATIVNPKTSKYATPTGHPLWFNYTPTWSATGVAPAIGNGTLLGRFSLGGRVVHFQILFTGGTTTTYGTGVWRFTVPLTVPSNSTNQQVHGPVGNWRGVDVGVADIAGMVEIISSTQIQMYGDYHAGVTMGQVDFLTNIVPMTWTTGDPLYIAGKYEL